MKIEMALGALAVIVLGAGCGASEESTSTTARSGLAGPGASDRRPQGGPFGALEVRARIGSEAWITQCESGVREERVWQTAVTGPNPDARWAKALYTQGPGASCGDPVSDVYPLVFRSLHPGELGAWVVACTGQDHQASVFHAQGEIVDGRPAAVFSHHEEVEGCP